MAWLIATPFLGVAVLYTGSTLWKWAWLRLIWVPATVDHYRRQQDKDPANPKWPQKLGFLYECRMKQGPPDERTQWAKPATAEYEKWLALTGPINHDYSFLSRLSQTALVAGEWEKARRYATRLVKMAERHPERGNAHHHGHIVLGRLALRSGQVQRAMEHLLAAGQTSGSPQLNSFGPQMNLAYELLEAGERDCVLQYLTLCSAFWRIGRRTLDRWTGEIRMGQTPPSWRQSFGSR
ncbi:MAG TPA: tetratricopeptide repeat protein [Armatimonadota bacterium]|nr:tetratricopeptide repeat protein [Armatimonadota bacterium]